MLGATLKKMRSNGKCVRKTLIPLNTTSEHKIQSEPQKDDIETITAALTALSTLDSDELLATILIATNSMQ